MPACFYGVSVGPGDAELMTVKALRCLERVPVIAAPRSHGRCTALHIARQLVDLTAKTVLYLDLPMTRDPEALAAAHRTQAGTVIGELRQGRDVAMLSLGDVSLYSTFSYLRPLVQAAGFPCAAIPGVTSFCAAAAALGRPLCGMDEPLTILPGAAVDDAALDFPGGKVIMKSGRGQGVLRQTLEAKGLSERAALAIRVGMEGQQLYPTLSAAPDTDDYFTAILID